MTTATQAISVIKARLVAQLPAVRFRWQNEEADSLGDVELPDTPAPFVFVTFDAQRGFLASFGSGRGANRYRNPMRVEAFALVPRGWGLAPATTLAEQVAAALRSYRDADVNCREATVYPGGDGSDLRPPGMQSEVGQYYWSGTEVLLFYDQIG